MDSQSLSCMSGERERSGLCYSHIIKRVSFQANLWSNLYPSVIKRKNQALQQSSRHVQIYRAPVSGRGRGTNLVILGMKQSSACSWHHEGKDLAHWSHTFRGEAEEAEKSSSKHLSRTENKLINSYYSDNMNFHVKYVEDFLWTCNIQ